MKHKATKDLFGYWNRVRGTRPAPARTSIEPAQIGQSLRDTFILESTGNSYSFRLAGTRICAAFCRELKGSSFTNLWREEDRDEIVALLEAVSEEGHGAVVGVSGKASGNRSTPFELLLLPMVHHGPAFDRILGLMTPMQFPHWLGLEPLRSQSLTSVRIVGPEALQPPSDAARLQPLLEPIPPQDRPESRRERFIVLDGGKPS